MLKDTDGNKYAFLVNYQQLVNDCFKQIIALLQDKVMAGMAVEKHSAIQKREVNLSLNLFSIISPVYHRENFHSDILYEFLSPGGKHKEGSKYLEAFLQFLNRLEADIALPDYANADIKREEGRIDIAILDKSSRKAINKLLPDHPYAIPMNQQMTMNYVLCAAQDRHLQQAVRTLCSGTARTPLDYELWTWNGWH